MNALSETDLIDLWEYETPKPWALRALAILRRGCPELAPERIGAMTIGERDVTLLALRTLAFGPQLDCIGHCPMCAEQLEMQVNGAELVERLRGSLGPPESRRLQTDEYDVEFRRPTVDDTCELAGLDDPAALRVGLLERCICRASRSGEPLEPDALSPSVQAAVEEGLEMWDPAAVIGLATECPACGEEAVLDLDISSFFWRELERKALEVLGDVHVLASAYGWSEGAILAMSPWRRRQYLSRIVA